MLSMCNLVLGCFGHRMKVRRKGKKLVIEIEPQCHRVAAR